MNTPKLYTKNRNLQETDNIHVLDNYLHLLQWPNTNGESSILDVGVGDGSFAVEVLLQRLPKVSNINCNSDDGDSNRNSNSDTSISEGFGEFIGCDISQEMIEFARQNYENSKRRFVQFDIAAQHVPAKFEGRFDHIFSFYTLHWVQEQRQAFRNIEKMLKPGGELLTSFLASNPIYDILHILRKRNKWRCYIKSDYIAPYHDSKLPEEELRNNIENAGLKCHVCKLERRNYSFPNFDLCRKTIAAVSPFLSKLSPEDAREYIEDFIKEVRCLKSITIEKFNNNEEKISFSYKLFVVYASKPITRSDIILS